MLRARLILILLLLSCFSLVAWFEPRRAARFDSAAATDSVLGTLLGDGRKTIADIAYVQSDVYFHSGYYPSVFDQARSQEEKDSDVSHPEDGQEPEEKGFLGEPLDWIDRLSRNFRPSRHIHLKGKDVGEMLPWMKLSAELDPHRVQTFTVTAYWLRSALGKSADAEDFVRTGLKANPHSPDLLFTLGQIYLEDRKDLSRARNILLAAVRCWHEQNDSKPAVSETGEARDYLLLERILSALALEEESAGRLEQAMEYLKVLKANAANPAGVQKLIDQLQKKIDAQK